MDQLK
jgi:hypothetical protein